MTVRTTEFGGTDFSDGEVLYAADLNDTFGASPIRFLVDESSTDTTEYSQTGTVNWGSAKTLTFTPSSSNNVIFGLKLECDLKTSNGSDYAYVSAGINNVPWGAVNDIEWPRYSNNSTEDQYTAYTLSTNYTSKTFYAGMFPTRHNDTNNENYGAGIAAGQSSYTIYVDIANQDATETTYIDNIKVTVYYMDDGKVTTSSGKFS